MSSIKTKINLGENIAGDIDLSSCFVFFDNDSGKDVDLVSSSTGTISPATLIEGGLALEINTYPYAFLILDNALQMKHVETFDSTITGATATGQTCWTLNKTTSISNTTNAGTRNGVATAAVTDGTRGTYAVDCGSTSAAAFQLSLIHISEPTRRRGIAVCGVVV